ncbi:hypothetical protein QZH41_020328, partial [Actinostola sp. cb2023]
PYNPCFMTAGGGTGFIGQRLQKTLKSKGHEVQIISRTKGIGRITWEEVALSGLPECQAVVNLAGELLLNPFKREGLEVRDTITVSILFHTGFYPPSELTEYTEDFPPSDTDVLTEICREWEASAQLPEGCNTRQVIVRIGVVLGKEGGILQQTIWPFWLGLGGVIGDGNQPFPWIHIQDICDIIVFAIENNHVTSVLNGVAPDLSTNRDFTKELASALCRPALFPVPAFAVNAVFGSERGAVMLQGPKVIPQRTLQLGYKFKFSDLKSAIANAIK